MSGHTPGPWKAIVDGDGGNLHIDGPDGELVVSGCGCCDSPYMDQEKAVADARLIAAAPDMLAALERAELALRFAKARGRLHYEARTSANAEYCDAVDGLVATIAAVHDAIAGATGGAA